MKISRIMAAALPASQRQPLLLLDAGHSPALPARWACAAFMNWPTTTA
ncbi:MAG: hypothetical protein ACFNZS_04750 [Ottowia sp.]